VLFRSDVHAVRSIAIQIAKCLQFLNDECEVMHGDVKARNFVSGSEGVGYAAIDLDNAALIDKENAGQKRTSSGMSTRCKRRSRGAVVVKASP